MTINEQLLTAARWRLLHPKLRAQLRQAFAGEHAIIGRPVLDLMRALSAMPEVTRDGVVIFDGRDLAIDLYDALSGGPAPEQHHECGLSRLHRLAACLGVTIWDL